VSPGSSSFRQGILPLLSNEFMASEGRGLGHCAFNSQSFVRASDPSLHGKFPLPGVRARYVLVSLSHQDKGSMTMKRIQALEAKTRPQVFIADTVSSRSQKTQSYSARLQGRSLRRPLSGARPTVMGLKILRYGTTGERYVAGRRISLCSVRKSSGLLREYSIEAMSGEAVDKRQGETSRCANSMLSGASSGRSMDGSTSIPAGRVPVGDRRRI
jgi:hypothetical protein